MSAKSLKLADPNATKARLSPGRQWIGIKNLEAPDELQPRAGIDKDWVSQLQGFRQDGSEFPPARVYQLADGRLMLAEGHHRRWALLGANEADMLCEVVDGMMEDAIEHAAGSNKSNGVKPMNRLDLQKAVRMVLSTDKGWNKGDHWIGRHTGCAGGMVTKIRHAISQESGKPMPVFIDKSDGSKGFYRIAKHSKNEIPRPHSNGRGLYQIDYRGVSYSGKTENEVYAKVCAIKSDVESLIKSLKHGNLTPGMARRGFKSIKWGPVLKNQFKGWVGHGIVCVSCDFSDRDSITHVVGKIDLLCVAAGRLRASRQKFGSVTRSVILCFKKYGPAQAIELFEEAGIEFMTPDELFRSLGANGMTPDEVLASLEKKEDAPTAQAD